MTNSSPPEFSKHYTAQIAEKEEAEYALKDQVQMDSKRSSVNKGFLLIIYAVDVVFPLDPFIVYSVFHVGSESLSKDSIADINICSYPFVSCSLSAYEGEKKQPFTAIQLG